METYKIKENWQDFKAFEEQELNNIDFMDIGYLYSADEILFRCTSEEVLNKIRARFEVKICERLPETEVTDTNMWRYFGNSSLFRN